MAVLIHSGFDSSLHKHILKVAARGSRIDMVEMMDKIASDLANKGFRFEYHNNERLHAVNDESEFFSETFLIVED